MSRRQLPCFPCPHAAACCSFGASITPTEHLALTAPGEHLPDKFVWDLAENGWRTRVVAGRCVFLAGDATCTLHDHPYYPIVCRCFPDAQHDTGGPYQGDVTICPELR